MSLELEERRQRLMAAYDRWRDRQPDTTKITAKQRSWLSGFGRRFDHLNSRIQVVGDGD